MNQTSESLSSYLNKQEMDARIGAGEVFAYRASVNIGGLWKHLLTGSYTGCVEVTRRYANPTRITEVRY